MSTSHLASLLSATIVLGATVTSVGSARASIAMDMCMSSGESFLGTRLAAATDIVLARPVALTYRDAGETRTMTATYEVLSVAKGGHAVGATISVQKQCGRRQQWYERRGYPSRFCSDGSNGAMPGFSGTTPGSSGTLLLTGTGVVGGDNDMGHGHCPSFDPAAAAAADPIVAASLAMLATAPELAPGASLPFRPLRPRRDP